MHPAKRWAAVAGVVGALAIAAPIAGAGAATTPGAFPGFPLPGFPFLPAFGGWPSSWVYPAVGGASFAKGPTVINDVFNGATVVQVVNGAAASSVLASP
jgi:hypothetical protein